MAYVSDTSSWQSMVSQSPTRFKLSFSLKLLPVQELPDGRDVFEVLADSTNFPLNLKFGRPTITTNEKIVLASIFYPLFALAVQLSPEQGSSGIREIETDTFRLHCHQTLTGVKFVVIADKQQVVLKNIPLNKSTLPPGWCGPVT